MYGKHRTQRAVVIFLFLLLFITPSVMAKTETEDHSIFQQRKTIFNQMSAVTGVPWYDFAAIDQYDRTMRKKRSGSRKNEQKLLAEHYTKAAWAGVFNPDQDDQNRASIAFFGGIGKDGSGDGLATRSNDVDELYTIAAQIERVGTSNKDFPIAIWNLYHNPRSVKRITEFAKIYQTFGTLQLTRHSFPLPLRSDYSYHSTWGASRGWGGYRIHEGTDLYAGYGVPVRSTCYGVIEIRGWNNYGGWRVGIRSLGNVYHYFAHLSGFNKKLKVGDVVKPGQVIGWVGSSGYGRKGTQGKFPPHLHYGMYRDNGLREWSFDPYPYLRRWEREERKRARG